MARCPEERYGRCPKGREQVRDATGARALAHAWSMAGQSWRHGELDDDLEGRGEDEQVKRQRSNAIG